MALAAWTWTAAGGQPGLASCLARPSWSCPTPTPTSWQASLRRFGRGVPAGIGVLGIGERTGVLIDPDTDAPWRVAGEGEVRWVPPGGDLARPAVYGAGRAFRPEGD